MKKEVKEEVKAGESESGSEGGSGIKVKKGSGSGGEEQEEKDTSCEREAKKTERKVLTGPWLLKSRP